MPKGSPVDSYRAMLDGLRSSGNFRAIPEPGRGEGMIDFSSNDYLGIASRPELLDEFMADPANRRLPFTSSASRLLAGRQEEYAELECYLSTLYGRPALLFNSGYHANTGLVSALASAPSTLVVADRLVHASIIDGITLSRARFTRFRHNDYAHLEQIMEKEAGAYDRALIIVESVYSMDGDRCDLARLAEIKRAYPGAMLYVDEAHSFGALGDRGLGISRGSEQWDDVDVAVFTLGKAAASSGAFAVMANELRDWAVNRARSFIFSTSLPPVNVAWSRFVIERITGMDAERRHLDALSQRLADKLGGEPRYIYPYIIGDAERAVAVSLALAERGLKVLPIRSPTVPAGTERLRISLSAAMTPDDIDRLAEALGEL